MNVYLEYDVNRERKIQNAKNLINKICIKGIPKLIEFCCNGSEEDVKAEMIW